eukprot:m.297158 g.297158  ORF g.297158 m.297158 type:complete len:143 (+) comp27196_c0_seq2:1248-1676(+)
MPGCTRCTASNIRGSTKGGAFRIGFATLRKTGCTFLALGEIPQTILPTDMSCCQTQYLAPLQSDRMCSARLPVALLDFAVESKWARVALYQVIFPISMLIALSVKPPKWSSILPARMPICRESQWATEWLLKQMLPKSLVTG